MKKAIQIGAGNIGRGFIGGLLSDAGYHVVFADVNAAVIDKINEDGQYTIHVMDVESSEQIITNISGISSAGPEMIDAVVEAEFITTAVGLRILPIIAPSIAQGIEKRAAQGVNEYLNIVACENAIRGTSQLKAAVYEKLSEEGKAYADKYVGFADCSVDRIVPPVKCDNPIDVVVEAYYEWNVEEAALKGPIPEIKGMNLAGNLEAYIERKLFTLNTGHCITAYLGCLKGYATIDEAIADEEIFKIVKSAMTESGMGLVQKHGLDKEAHLKYIDKIIGRFNNPYLKDDVLRVGRDPLRKLSPTDRLANPTLTAAGFGLPVDNLLVGIAAALHYKDDKDLTEKINELGVRGFLTEFSGIKDETLLDKIEANYAKLA
ncbi:MAG: mannitol-1-phosphate 5-dehydrogenase [Lachnospiraceae bacterium]|nr:mannitol-1-phosphate 5-dehydrogenase [Lachnospiraceae bacterium]